MKKFYLTPFQIFLLIAIAVFSSSCHHNQDFKGRNFSNENVANLKKGQSKDDVIEIIGNPSTKSVFGKEKWFYLYEVTEKTSKVRDTLIERKTLTLTFNSKNRLEKIALNEEKNPKISSYNEEYTPIKGDDSSLLKETIKNFGRFNKKRSIER